MTKGKEPGPALLRFLASYYGLVEPEPTVLLMTGATGGETAVVGQLGHKLAQVPGSASLHRVGIGVCRKGDAFAAVLVMEKHVLSLKPMARALRAGGRAAVTGRVATGFHDPEVLLTVPSGAVRLLPTRVRGARFRAEMVCAWGAGAYQVEIMAQDQGGPNVVANFPVYCGRPPPAHLLWAAAVTPPAASGSGPASDASPGVLEQEILVLMNRDRAASGLPPLLHDARLAEVARAYSREMAAKGEVAHFSRRSGSAVDRVRAAGIAPLPTVVAENVGRDYSAEEIERGFMASPGHRRNILSGEVTRAGVGVAVGPRENGVVPLFVTQLLVGWGK
jgi:uncharacterized protein YkwD